jgi:hypothetical protein
MRRAVARVQVDECLIRDSDLCGEGLEVLDRGGVERKGSGRCVRSNAWMDVFSSTLSTTAC